MMNTPLDTSLDSYKKLIEDLESKLLIDTSRVLEILSARDALQITLKKQKPVSSAQLQQVIELDACLRANASRIILEIDKDKGKEFIHWRKSVQPSDEAWWWQLDTIDSPPPKEKLEWFFRGLWIAGWAANVSLMINIASRLGGAGSVGFFDPMVVILPGIGALISASDKLPKFEKLLKALHIPQPNRELTKLLATMMVSGVLVGGGYVILPFMSKKANSDGIKKYGSGDLFEAEKEYKKAISLDGNNINAHFNLGSLHEISLEIEKAKKQYQFAIANKSPQAYNNLGRLYIQEKKYAQAAALLKIGLIEANNKNSTPEVKYSLYKNLGWARLKQERYEEAREVLQKAVDILKTPTDEKYIYNPGASHCLLAQTLEHLKQPEYLEELEKCSQTPLPTGTLDPDEDSWRYLAIQKLAKPKTLKLNNEKTSKVK